MNGSSKILKKVLKRLGKRRFPVFLTLFLSAVTAASALYIPILVGRAIDCIVGTGEVDLVSLSPLLIRIALIASFTALLQWVQNTLNNRITFETVRDLRSEAFAKLQTLPLSYLDTHRTGDLVSRIIADADTFADGLLMGFTQLFGGIVTILVTLLFMLTIQPLITLAVVVLTPLSLFAAKFIASRTHSMFALRSETQGEQTALIDEMIGGQKVVQAFSMEEHVNERFRDVNKRLKNASLRAIFYSSITNPATRFLNNVIYAVVGLCGALCVIAGGGMTVGGLSSFLSYANQYTKPFNEISGVIAELQNALTCADRIFSLLEEEPEPSDEGAGVLPLPEGRVEMKDLSFSYLPDRPLIERLSLSVRPGMHVAIVGRTGCGKTTLINLLMRFYDPDAGAVSVDGTDICTVTRESLRRGYGMVLQETWLTDGTVRENIAFGRPDATEEEIVEAAKLCRAHGFIKRLPQGYDTPLREDGADLSAGQKQLLCIARVMLAHPPMLILDEATSSLDTRTERKISRAFETLMRGRTAFIVAHRLSTVREADLILVMEAGKVVETGTHAELLARGGEYTRLYRSQFS